MTLYSVFFFVFRWWTFSKTKVLILNSFGKCYGKCFIFPNVFNDHRCVKMPTLNHTFIKHILRCQLWITRSWQKYLEMPTLNHRVMEKISCDANFESQGHGKNILRIIFRKILRIFVPCPCALNTYWNLNNYSVGKIC